MQLLCIIVEKESYVSAFKDFKPDDTAEAKSVSPKQAPKQEPRQDVSVQQQAKPTVQPQQQHGTLAPFTDRLKATPYAKKLASEHGRSLAEIQGSGPGIFRFQ